MSIPDFRSDRSQAQQHLLIASALILTVLAGSVAMVVRLTHSGPAGATGRSTPQRSASSGQPDPTAPQAEADPDADISWVDVAGVQVPVSKLHGPRVTDHGRAAGYSHSPQGAALAAVQVLLRASATAGPNVYVPILTSQVTGANVADLTLNLDAEYGRLRSQRGVQDGQPIPGNDGTVLGYIITGYDPLESTARIEVILTAAPLQAAGQLIVFTVSLTWANDDWRVFAPPRGDWSSVARTLGAPPSGMLDYRAMT
jgi:hypothetical protein